MLRFSGLNAKHDENSLEASMGAGGSEDIPHEEVLRRRYEKALHAQVDSDESVAPVLFRDLLKDPKLSKAKAQLDEDGSRYLPGLALIKYLALKNLASILEKIESEWPDAFKCYGEALELDSSDMVLWHRFGSLAMKLNRFEIARYAFEQGLRRCPNHPLSTEGLCDALFILGDYISCHALLCKYLMLEPYFDKGFAMRKYIEGFVKNEFSNKRSAEDWPELADLLEKRQKVHDADVCVEIPDALSSKVPIPAFSAISLLKALHSTCEKRKDVSVSGDGEEHPGQKPGRVSICISPEMLTSVVLFDVHDDAWAKKGTPNSAPDGNFEKLTENNFEEIEPSDGKQKKVAFEEAEKPEFSDEKAKDQGDEKKGKAANSPGGAASRLRRSGRSRHEEKEEPDEEPKHMSLKDSLAMYLKDDGPSAKEGQDASASPAQKTSPAKPPSKENVEAKAMRVQAESERVEAWLFPNGRNAGYAKRSLMEWLNIVIRGFGDPCSGLILSQDCADIMLSLYRVIVASHCDSRGLHLLTLSEWAMDCAEERKKSLRSEALELCALILDRLQAFVQGSEDLKFPGSVQAKLNLVVRMHWSAGLCETGLGNSESARWHFEETRRLLISMGLKSIFIANRRHNATVTLTDLNVRLLVSEPDGGQTIADTNITLEHHKEIVSTLGPQLLDDTATSGSHPSRAFEMLFTACMATDDIPKAIQCSAVWIRHVLANGLEPKLLQSFTQAATAVCDAWGALWSIIAKGSEIPSESVSIARERGSALKRGLYQALLFEEQKRTTPGKGLSALAVSAWTAFVSVERVLCMSTCRDSFESHDALCEHMRSLVEIGHRCLHQTGSCANDKSMFATVCVDALVLLFRQKNHTSGSGRFRGNLRGRGQDDDESEGSDDEGEKEEEFPELLDLFRCLYGLNLRSLLSSQGGTGSKMDQASLNKIDNPQASGAVFVYVDYCIRTNRISSRKDLHRELSRLLEVVYKHFGTPPIELAYFRVAVDEALSNPEEATFTDHNLTPPKTAIDDRFLEVYASLYGYYSNGLDEKVDSRLESAKERREHLIEVAVKDLWCGSAENFHAWETLSRRLFGMFAALKEDFTAESAQCDDFRTRVLLIAESRWKCVAASMVGRKIYESDRKWKDKLLLQEKHTMFEETHPHAHRIIGDIIFKRFGTDGVFEGQIEAFTEDGGYYVVFEDDEAEWLSQDDIDELISDRQELSDARELERIQDGKEVLNPILKRESLLLYDAFKCCVNRKDHYADMLRNVLATWEDVDDSAWQIRYMKGKLAERQQPEDANAFLNHYLDAMKKSEKLPRPVIDPYYRIHASLLKMMTQGQGNDEIIVSTMTEALPSADKGVSIDDGPSSPGVLSRSMRHLALRSRLLAVMEDCRQSKNSHPWKESYKNLIKWFRSPAFRSASALAHDQASIDTDGAAEIMEQMFKFKCGAGSLILESEMILIHKATRRTQKYYAFYCSVLERKGDFTSLRSLMKSVQKDFKQSSKSTASPKKLYCIGFESCCRILDNYCDKALHEPHKNLSGYDGDQQTSHMLEVLNDAKEYLENPTPPLIHAQQPEGTIGATDYNGDVWAEQYDYYAKYAKTTVSQSFLDSLTKKSYLVHQMKAVYEEAIASGPDVSVPRVHAWQLEGHLAVTRANGTEAIRRGLTTIHLDEASNYFSDERKRQRGRGLIA